MAAFQAALDAGSDGIELDVFLTVDNHVIVFHDEDTERLTHVQGDITKMTLNQVRKLRVEGNPIPTLEEVLTTFADKLLVNVELKAFRPEWERRHTGTEAAKVIRKCKASERVVVTSFDPFMLWYLEREYPGLHSGFAYDDGMKIDLDAWFEKLTQKEIVDDVISFASRFEKITGGITSAVKWLTGWLTSERFVTFIAEMNVIGRLINSTVVDVEHTMIDNNTIETFHKKEMAIGAYTFFSTDPSYINKLNDEEQMKRIRQLADQKVDWIETDDPGRVKEALNAGV
jgi:glycerophosphoryl diester phosphodiesterase